MKCMKCNFEPEDALFITPCENCGAEWFDTFDYVEMLAKGLDIKTVLDIGCGTKGMIAQHYWEAVKRIETGYACDRWVLKDMTKPWVPLLMDAEELLEVLPDGVDFVTHCGMLEHIEYDKALRILHVIEQVAKKGVFFSASAQLREVDYKVQRDGNLYHYYRSWWCGPVFEALGYHVDRERMISQQTFSEEVMGWYYPEDIKETWEVREERARQILTDRRCFFEGCECEPVHWGVDTNRYYCLDHFEHSPKKHGKQFMDHWKDRPDLNNLFERSRPPWRAPLEIIHKQASWFLPLIQLGDIFNAL